MAAERLDLVVTAGPGRRRGRSVCVCGTATLTRPSSTSNCQESRDPASDHVELPFTRETMGDYSRRQSSPACGPLPGLRFLRESCADSNGHQAGALRTEAVRSAAQPPTATRAACNHTEFSPFASSKPGNDRAATEQVGASPTLQRVARPAGIRASRRSGNKSELAPCRNVVG